MTQKLADKMDAELDALGLVRPADLERVLAEDSGLGDVDELVAMAALVDRRRTDRFLWDMLHSAGRRLESPMEAVLYIAMRLYAGEAGLWPELFILHHACPNHAEPNPGVPPYWRSLGICQQHQVGYYRLDFLVSAYHGQALAGTVAVEVDGHDFHERTKEQARHDRQKDRAIQKSGYRIFRYTGSEVYAKPIACAKEVVDAAFGENLSEWLAVPVLKSGL